MGSVASGSGVRRAAGRTSEAMIVGSSAPVMTASDCGWLQEGWLLPAA